MKNLHSIFVTTLFLLLGAFAGYYFGVRGYEVQLKKDVKSIEVVNKTPKIANNINFERFWDVWDRMSKEHIKRPLDPEKMLNGAIHGMVDSVGDPYSTYLDPKENADALSSLNGKYEGIGAQLGYDEDKRLIIVAPIEDSPAEKAGVRAGDIIISIEGKEVTGITVEEAVNKIRGEAGTISHLTLFRKEKGEPFDVNITRETISIKSVKWEDKGEGVVYIKLSRFGQDTNTEWTKVVKEVVSQMPNLKGIILDVRNNPGGYLDSAIYIASEFIDSGVVVSEDFADGKTTDYKVNRTGLLTNSKYKLTVLINEGSASASEIVAGALKERKSAVLVGKRSFGKGSVQKAEDFDDGASLHVSIAKWLTPNRNWIDKHNSVYKDSVYNETKDGKEIVGGIKTDIEVDLTDKDLENKKDTQLDKAIELTKEATKK